MIITGIKLANPIQLAGKLDHYFEIKNHEITIDGAIITITHRKKEVSVCTSIYNTIYFTIEQASGDAKTSKKRTRNSSKRA